MMTGVHITGAIKLMPAFRQDVVLVSIEDWLHRDISLNVAELEVESSFH